VKARTEFPDIDALFGSAIPSGYESEASHSLNTTFTLQNEANKLRTELLSQFCLQINLKHLCCESNSHTVGSFPMDLYSKQSNIGNDHGTITGKNAQVCRRLVSKLPVQRKKSFPMLRDAARK
jgi:hypothetical protein